MHFYIQWQGLRKQQKNLKTLIFVDCSQTIGYLKSYGPIQ